MANNADSQEKQLHCFLFFFFCHLLERRSSLIERNLLLKKQILYLKVDPCLEGLVAKKAKRKSIKLSPCEAKMMD